MDKTITFRDVLEAEEREDRAAVTDASLTVAKCSLSGEKTLMLKHFSMGMNSVLNWVGYPVLTTLA